MARGLQYPFGVMKKTLNIAVAVLLGLVLQARGDRVLCIGLNESRNYKTLSCAEDDATEMARVLNENGHEATVLTRGQVTRENILKALESKPEMIYFAGHGEKSQLVLSDGQINIDEIAQHTAMMFLDCCYVGKDLGENGGTRVFAAAQYEAFESDGHGLFTKCLLDWMEKGRGLSDGGMTNFVEKSVARETGGWQKPVLGYI